MSQLSSASRHLRWAPAAGASLAALGASAPVQPGTHQAFEQIVRGGALVANRMPRWDDVLSEADTRAIHAWLIEEQRKTRADELAKKAKGVPLDAPSLAISSSY